MSMLVNPYIFGGGGSLYYGTAEDLTGGTASNTTYADKLSVTPPAGMVNGRQYLILWSFDAQYSAANSATAQLTIDGTGQGEQIVSGVADRYTFGGSVFYTAGASAPTLAIQAKVSGSSTDLSNLRITWLALVASQDYTQESLTRQTTTSTTMQTAATLSFTDTGDYLVLASFELDGTNIDPQFELSDGTVTITGRLNGDVNASRRRPIVLLLDIGAVSGSKSVTVKYRSSLGTTTGITDVRILAIQLDRFANSYLTTLAADNGGTETSYTVALTQTFTPAASDHLVLGWWGTAGTSTTQQNHGRLNDGGTVLGESIQDPTSNTTSRPSPSFSHQLATYTASSRTQTIERRAETSNTAYINAKAMIVTLDLAGIS